MFVLVLVLGAIGIFYLVIEPTSFVIKVINWVEDNVVCVVCVNSVQEFEKLQSGVHIFVYATKSENQ